MSLPELTWNRETKSWEQVLQRLMKKIEMVTESGCWIWMGANKGEEEYGRAYFCGKRFSVHKLLYEIVRGPVPPELVLDHLCRVRICANPWHQEPVTDAVNIERGEAPGHVIKRSGACLYGHVRDEINTRQYRDGPICRICERDRAHRRRHGMDN